MASTYSALKIQLMATGENSGTWGNVTNVNLGTALEEAIVGSADVTFSSADVTLTLTDSNASQGARNLRLNLTGTISSPQNLVVPAIEKVYIVNNGLTQTVTVKNSTGTGIAVPAGKTMYVYNTGANVVDAITHLTSLTLGTALPAGSGGTGLTAPGTSGNILSSNGTAWVSSAPASSGFDSGTVMLFGQTSAPTGWTKDTTNYNNSGLRVVTGSASTGGSVDFTTAFASQTPTGSVSISSVSGSAGATTLSTPQIPSHTHTTAYQPGGKTNNPLRFSGTGPYDPPSLQNSGSTGGGGSHTHPFSFSSGSGTFSGNAINLAVKYVDVIRATKD
jgi:hypothetical protein